MGELVELSEILWPYLAGALAVGVVFGFMFCRTPG